MHEGALNNSGKGKVVVLWFVVIVGILLAFGFWLLSSTSKHYKDIFDATHLVEFAEGARAVKRGALEKMAEDDSPLTEDDPRVFISSKGVALSYTIAREAEDGETRFVHHYAISQAGRPTTHALGEFFSHYAAILLNLTQPPTAAFSSEVGVHHSEFTLTPAEQEEWRQQTVAIPTGETLPAVQQKILERRERVPFKTVSVGPNYVTERF
jgi:hypothetical protein